MAVWLKLQNLLDEDARTKLHEIYGKFSFPLEVRGLFAEWIESQSWHVFDENIIEHKIQMEALAKELIKKLEEKSQQPANDLITQMRLKDLSKYMKGTYEDNLCNLVSTIKDILAAEQELIQIVEKPTPVLSPMMEIEAPESPAIPNIKEFIEGLKEEAKKTDVKLKDYKQMQEDFVIRYQEICKVDGEITQAQLSPAGDSKNQKLLMLNKKKTQVEEMLRKKALDILESRGSIVRQLEDLSSKIELVSQKVFEKLFLWRINQQKSLSGGEKPGPLDELQGWFELLTDTEWSMYQLCTQYKLLFDALPITRAEDEDKKVERMVEQSVSNLTTLIQRSFIVEKQPPQVLKTQTKFQASVRLLVGSKLNLQMNCPEVVTTILSEKQAKDLVNGKTIEDVGNCGEILNNRGVMEYNQQLHALHADFKNLSLKKIKRQDRKGQESVLEAKSCLVFSASITIGGDKLPVTCMSVPVVVVVHGNQGPNSEATVFWDNFFSSPDREPFTVPEEVDWEQMAYALDSRWAMTAECHLVQPHLEYLGTKLFVADSIVHSERKIVSWHTFNKEPLRGRNFTFWEWFHAGMEVVKRHLKDHWSDGYLQFMSREDARNYLLHKAPGTFLIRFSDGEIGGVSIAWVTHENEVFHLQPWTAKDFNIRSLADRIFDLNQLIHVYPDTPKDVAFGKFRSQECFSGRPDPEGYVLSSIMTTINIDDRQSDGSRMDSLASPTGATNQHLLNMFDPSLASPIAFAENAATTVEDFDSNWVNQTVDDLESGLDPSNTVSIQDFINSLHDKP
eukprot:gene3212-3689_t